MRFAAIVLASLLFAAPASAQVSPQQQMPGQSAPAPTSGTVGHAFGSANCPTRVTCPDDAAVDASSIVPIANACITRYFGYSSPSGFFDENEGLNANNCLTALPDILPKGVGAPLSPLCCIIKMPDSSCLVHCDLVSTQ